MQPLFYFVLHNCHAYRSEDIAPVAITLVSGVMITIIIIISIIVAVLISSARNSRVVTRRCSPRVVNVSVWKYPKEIQWRVKSSRSSNVSFDQIKMCSGANRKRARMIVHRRCVNRKDTVRIYQEVTLG